MIFGVIRQWNENLRRRVRRTFLADPEKTPQRLAIVMASFVLLSIVVTYNVLFEREKAKEGIKPPTVTELYREKTAKERREHLELQRNILQAKDQSKRTTVNDL